MRLGLSQRWDSRLSGLSRRLIKQAEKADKDEALKERLRGVWRPNMGYRMAHALVRSEFAPLNVKRVHRVWKAERLGRVKRYRKRRTGSSVPLEACAPNHVWTVDFIHDSCLRGTRLKILTVVDEFTRECLALEVATKINAVRVREVLLPLMRERGAPGFVRSDNGGEFIARLIAVFLSGSGSGSHFIQPGNPGRTALWSRLTRPCAGITWTWRSSSTWPTLRRRRRCTAATTTRSGPTHP